MKADCAQLGMTPLSEASFREEESRIYMDLMNRRAGLGPKSGFLY